MYLWITAFTNNCNYCNKVELKLLTCHGNSANFDFCPPIIRLANWRWRVMPHSGSLCRISLSTRFWARPVPTKVSWKRKINIWFFFKVNTLNLSISRKKKHPVKSSKINFQLHDSARFDSNREYSYLFDRIELS